MFDIKDGIDLFKEKVGYESDREEYFCMNVVSGKYHTGGTSCTYKGNTVPCFVELSEGGGISGHNLMKVLRHLDYLKWYGNDGKNGIIPALLVDGHVSHFNLGF